MIIECKNCSTKFVVNDNAISANGRTVQCSNCSVQWLQLPISSTPDTIESEEVVAPSPEEKEIDTHFYLKSFFFIENLFLMS